jgi:LysM repeat protein
MKNANTGRCMIKRKILTTLAVTLAAANGGAWAQFVTTPAQKATAEQVAQSGVPLSELAPNAPDQYTVKRGDTLWAISRIFLRSPWRWPELWGMNLNDIRNPHRIYPGQTLYLDKSNGRARLSTRPGGAGGSDVVKVSPRVRSESLSDSAIPTIATQFLEPFLAEPMVLDEDTLTAAPRIAATQEGRVLLSRGDRAYARSADGKQLSTAKGQPQDYRVFRNAKPLKDPVSGVVLGYEAEFVGTAELVRPESTADGKDKEGKTITEIIPATIDIVSSKEEMRTGDRLVPEPPREFATYVPRAPESAVEARVVSVYGSAVRLATQNQVVVINKGNKDGIERGHVLAIITEGERLTDKTVAGGKKEQIKLPDERNGLAMVFKTFDKLSYALILQVNDGVKVGDRMISPK